MSQQKGMDLREFRQRFHTEEDCKAYLFEQRLEFLVQFLRFPINRTRNIGSEIT